MKKHFQLTIILILTVIPLWAEGLELRLDSGSLVSLFGETIHVRLEGELALSDEFSLTLPFEATFEKGKGEPIFLEAALLLAYHPFSVEATIYASLLQVGVLLNRRYDENEVFFLNEVGFGYPIRFPFGLNLEPRLTIKDPNGVFKGDYHQVREAFTSYPMIRFGLYVGWSFPLPSGAHSMNKGVMK